MKYVPANEESELLLKEILSEIQQVQRPADEVILDDVDLRERLKVSKRTTAEWRARKLIRFFKVQGKIFYKWSDVLKFLEKNAYEVAYDSLKITL